ncbi:INO80 complex subunit D-B [Chanos chanos]|uniref:INO80 complex subunit D-B n=1 Tax=Chanos chanos TaxID=29144 RepID=A0A6J2VX79_CHACN|nr:INO80 complex subunit D [Chanos chanos]
MFEGKHIHFSEVDHKPLCSYSPKLCKQRRLNGYAFCIRHVLEDRSAPFRQCEYVAKYNSQRCTNPIPKAQDRKYCNSHLQVMGVLPKKERKKRQDALETLALNITVPSLALKNPNGVDRLSSSPLPSLACLLPLDPFAFCKVEKEGGTFRKKPQSRLGPNPKQKHKDPQMFAELAKPSPLSPPAPKHSHLSPSSRQVGPSQSLVAKNSPAAPASPHAALQRSSLCKTGLPQTSGQTVSGPTATNHKTDPCYKPSLDRRAAPVVSHVPSSSVTTQVVPSAAPPLPRSATPLQRLMDQHSRRHKDLSPHLGLDWSEDSAEDDEEEVGRLASYQYQRLQRKHSQESAEGSRGRGDRLANLSSYLRQKHKHLCREERAFRRERRSQDTLRKALLQAAKHDPLQTAHLIQSQHDAPPSVSRLKRPLDSDSDSGFCSAVVKEETCGNRALPFTRHCFQHILQNRSQQLFSSCTARFADGAQCSVPVFDITHQTPLCDEHAKKMDNFLRGDVSRKTYHHHQQQQRKPLKKTKPSVLTKKHKKGKRGPGRRPQKPIPPALPQGNLVMPPLPMQTSGLRSPLTPDLSADEFPDDIANDISDIPQDLELNQEDFSDVLPRLPDDLQDFDLFGGKSNELLPTSEEAEELVRVLQAMGSYPESLVCLSSMGELEPAEGAECRAMVGGMVDLLSARLSADSLSALELDPGLLPHSEVDYPPSPLSPQPPLTPPSSVPASTAANLSHLTDGTFPQRHAPHLSAKADASRGDLVGDLPPLGREEDSLHGSWGMLPLPLTDSPHFHSLVGPEILLTSTSLSTPPVPLATAPCQPTADHSALPQSSLTIPVTSATSSPPQDLFSSGLPKHPLPPPMVNHCGIPADLQPHHSLPAPPMDQG